ncbi:RNA binding protein fox-1 homolog 3 isoform X8 [Dromaius novaehollandiae]|uniref:RNA binding protein fox-1 homolog 3 isoform X8 n=1 Tax=Dromaius novaehollandiae TaxID=8790 RepID=UPI00311E9F6F
MSDRRGFADRSPATRQPGRHGSAGRDGPALPPGPVPPASPERDPRRVRAAAPPPHAGLLGAKHSTGARHDPLHTSTEPRRAAGHRRQHTVHSRDADGTADRRSGTDRQPTATPLREHRQAAAQAVTRLQHPLSVPGPRPAANVRAIWEDPRRGDNFQRAGLQGEQRHGPGHDEQEGDKPLHQRLEAEPGGGSRLRPRVLCSNGVPLPRHGDGRGLPRGPLAGPRTRRLQHLPRRPAAAAHPHLRRGRVPGRVLRSRDLRGLRCLQIRPARRRRRCLQRQLRPSVRRRGPLPPHHRPRRHVQHRHHVKPQPFPSGTRKGKNKKKKHTKKPQKN